MKKGIVIIFLMAGAITVAQPHVPPKAISQINSLIAEENYPKAIEVISKLKPLFPNDPRLDLKMGICYLNSLPEQALALSSLGKAVALLPIKGKTVNDGIEANFYYGQAFHRAGRFFEAKAVFESLRNQIPPKQKGLLARVDKELQIASNAIELSINPVSFQINNLGPQINTPFDEHSPVVDPTESILIFTSNQRSGDEHLSSNSFLGEGIYISRFKNHQWQKASPIGNHINAQGSNASVSISPDGEKLVIYQHDGLSGDLYVCTFINQTLSEPEKLPAPINTSHNETHGCFSSDGQMFYFTSDRPGGYGDRDIYVVRKLPNGEWGNAQNLGASINTEGSEESPFLTSDGNTLYFASTEHKTIGGYDIFKSVKTDSSNWSTPINIGYPINTPEDDLFFNPSADGTRIYYASQHKGGMGGSDIYLIELPETDPRSLAVVSGFVFDAKKNPFADIALTLFDADTGKTVGIYKPNSSSGKYVMIVPSGKSYRLAYVTANQTFERTFYVSSRQSYESGNWTHYLDPVFIDK
ncbi:MAG: hypothetical protein QM786_00795 [Breznakibacter sp.]